mmetsp:Transcript_17901/g.30443  ORF Transcript_17901/g.30443 Transcript_17901/m.30443 type:complete len:93 (+) Transcript_17901:3149-3427(+)
MLSAKDLHISQVVISLQSIVNHQAALLDTLKCKSDVELLIKMLKEEQVNGQIQPMEEDKLTGEQGEHMKLSENYLNFMDPATQETYNAIEKC